MEYMHKLKEGFCKELEQFGSKDRLNPQESEYVGKILENIKNIYKNEVLKEEAEGGYSEAGGSYRGSYGAMSYDDDVSYARRGRGRYAKRDRMGRYSSEGGYSESYDDDEDSFDMGSHRGYSRDRARDHIMKKLGSIMENASETEREVLKDAMRKIEKM